MQSSVYVIIFNYKEHFKGSKYSEAINQQVEIFLVKLNTSNTIKQ